ncbi:hypothetical protein PS664_00858 [Pseudomonas fluorescens]|nr:hypothetical protein PS664_00858 [Pseudomonas fluorescens]
MANPTSGNNRPSQPEDILLQRYPRGRSPGGAYAVKDLIVTNALPDIPGGQPSLMLLPTLYSQGVMCSIDQWTDNFPFPGTDPDQLQVYINDVPYGPRIPFSKPLSAHTWPYTFSIPEQDIGEHGEKRLSYEIFTGVGDDEKSGNTRVNIDRLDPNARVLPEAIIFPAWVGLTLTLEALAEHGDVLQLTVPALLDSQEGDRLMVFWGFPNPVAIFAGPVPKTNAPYVVTLTTAQIVAQGPGLKYIAYRYTDRAGNNTSWPPELAMVTVVTEPSPVNLTPPRIPAAPLDLNDAQLGKAEVFLDGYGNAAVGDDIQIDFNGQLITHTLKSLSWPQIVEIPWNVLRDAGGLTEVYEALVRYRVIRSGTPSDYSAMITADVDLTSAGGRPEDPGPVNPDLGLIEVESSQGLINIIGAGDKGNATARFDVYPGARAGHRIQIYWNGIPALTPPYTVTEADETAAQFEITILASVIALGGNGDGIPVWAGLNNGTNNNVIFTLETPVDVFAAELSDIVPIEYPDATPAGGGLFVLTCQEGVTDGIRTKILDPGNLRIGDQVILVWLLYGPDDFFSDIPTVEHTFDPVTVMGDHNVPGHPGELRTIPFPTFIEPVLKGRIESYYLIKKADGVTQGESDPTVVYLTRYKADGTICG